MKMDFSVRCSSLKTIVSRKVILLFHISAVDVDFLGWDLLVSLIKSWTFSVTVPKKGSIINERFHWYFYVGLGLFQSPPCRYLQKTLFKPNATPWV